MPSLFEEEIHLATRAIPFVPFNLVLSGGIRYIVTGPDSIVVRNGVIDHYPPSTDVHNVLRTSKLSAIELVDRR